MRRTKVSAPRLLALMGAVSLLATPALARDVTVYGGGKSRVVETGTERPVKVIAWGKNRQSAYQKRVERFTLERKIQTILNARDTDEEVALSDAMLRYLRIQATTVANNFAQLMLDHCACTFSPQVFDNAGLPEQAPANIAALLAHNELCA